MMNKVTKTLIFSGLVLLNLGISSSASAATITNINENLDKIGQYYYGNELAGKKWIISTHLTKNHNLSPLNAI
ncbi:hypothetical protein, partial [Enterococcus faecalis]